LPGSGLVTALPRALLALVVLLALALALAAAGAPGVGEALGAAAPGESCLLSAGLAAGLKPAAPPLERPVVGLHSLRLWDAASSAAGRAAARSLSGSTERR
jgi:hypothetical protein